MLMQDPRVTSSFPGGGTATPSSARCCGNRNSSSPSAYEMFIRMNPHLTDEINRFAEEKKRLTMQSADEDDWRNTIKQEVEENLDRRVREALEPAPNNNRHGNRSAKPTQKEQELEALERLNSHIDLHNVASKEQEYDRQWKVIQAKRKIKRIMSESHFAFSPNSNRNRYFDEYGDLKDGNEPSSLAGYGTRFTSISTTRANKSQDFYEELLNKAETNYACLSAPEKFEFFYQFTRNGFKDALRTGKLPDGSDIEFLADGKCKDRFGIIRDEHGPFWPADFGPLHPVPRHRKEVSRKTEPLVRENSDDKFPTVDTQKTSYAGKWRGVQIVYDSEKSCRDQSPRSVVDGIAPSLVFESRFESGNLRQARRIGQYEYELILRTDLYTNRHTQWYYFRITNALPGITYRFKIINLHKNSSLYNYGMKPLMYSEKLAEQRNQGWCRAGHHIHYTRNNNHLQSPLLQRDGRAFYMLDWQMEFPSGDDTYYLAHCYPYTFTDLRDDLDVLLADPERSKIMKREVMCETRAGNSCFLVTVSDFDEPQGYSSQSKQAIVVTARVHPGETNSSWVMKGLLEFITGPSEMAKSLRKKFLFKIIPMLNPDGVIVGNYRCSLAARDLNRNYRQPRRENFPTVYHVKAMMEDLGRMHNILIYCDLHGHSRKQNVFMYGCNTMATPTQPISTSEEYLKERLFPWLMSQKAPDKFWFHGCKFQVKKCKESTGRVVMFRQLNIANSFTMEATFCGSTICREERRHFNTCDFQDMGRVFCEVVMDYSALQENQALRSEVVLDLTRAITQSILESRGLLPPDLPDFTTARGREELKAYATDGKISTSEQIAAAFIAMVTKENKYNRTQSNHGNNSLSNAKDIHELLEIMSAQTIDGCVNVLEQLHVADNVESDSSDSDSESEPEMKYTDHKSRRRKKNKKKKDKKAELNSADKTKNLPALTEAERRKKQEAQLAKYNSKNFINPAPAFVNRYKDRSNGGIPCFSEERLMERASKRVQDQKRMDEDQTRRELLLYSMNSDDSDYRHISSPVYPAQALSSRYQFGQSDGLQGSHAFYQGGPLSIKTGYIHADGYTVDGQALHHIDDNSSDSDEDFEGVPARMPLAAIKSPYTNLSMMPGQPFLPPRRVGSCSIPLRHTSVENMVVAPLSLSRLMEEGPLPLKPHQPIRPEVQPLEPIVAPPRDSREDLFSLRLMGREYTDLLSNKLKHTPKSNGMAQTGRCSAGRHSTCE